MQQLRKYLTSILLFVLILGPVSFGFHSVLESTAQNEKESLEKAVYRGMMECYALEGYYPSELDYLIEHYHIVYNQDKYEIRYEVIASNIIPNITIIEKN